MTNERTLDNGNLAITSEIHGAEVEILSIINERVLYKTLDAGRTTMNEGAMYLTSFTDFMDSYKNW